MATEPDTVRHATEQRVRGGWQATGVFLSSLLLIVVGFGLGLAWPVIRQAMLPPPPPPPPVQQVMASPDYAYVMTLWLNMEQIAERSNSLDESANDLLNHAISYRYFRVRATRLGSDIGRYGLEARQIAAPANLADLNSEYLLATEELTSSTTVLNQALLPSGPDAALLAKSDAQRIDAVSRLESVSTQLLHRVWHQE